MKIVILVGMPLSGKTSHANKLGDSKKIPLVETGTFVYNAVAEKGLTATPENIKQVALECKKINDAYFTIQALNYTKQNLSNEKIIFLSGLKSKSEVKLCEEEFGSNNVFTVAFHASISTRQGRLENEDRKASSKLQGESKSLEDRSMALNLEKFSARDQKELSYGIGDLIALSDFLLNTEDKKWPYTNSKKSHHEFSDILSKISKNGG